MVQPGEHKLKYKNQAVIEEKLRQELTECAETISNIDEKMEKIHNRIKIYKDKEGK